MMNPEDMVFAPVVLPLLGAALVFCTNAFLKNTSSKVLEYTGVFIGLILPWGFFLYSLPIVFSGKAIQGVIGNWHSGVGIMYRFDGLTWLVNVLGFTVCAAAWIYSLGAGPRGMAFSAVLLVLTAGLAATIMTADLFNLFVCLEVVGIASYILVASSDRPGASLASFSYLMISASAMVFFLLGVYGLYRLTGSLSYEGIATGLQNLPDAGGVTARVSLTLVVSAVAIRVAAMPYSGWLPDAHALAPHAVSAILSGVLIKTPLFALSRVLFLMPAGARVGQLMGYAGAVTALVGVVLALSQKDAKRLLANHSISQIGYVVSAWGAAIHVGVSTGAGIALMSAAFLHAFYHALFKGLLFLSVGTTIDRAGQGDVYLLRGAAGILRRHGEKIPVTLTCFIIGALAISAIPPLNGFASKSALAHALEGSLHYYLLMAAGIGTTASFIKLSRIFWPKEPVDTAPDLAAIPQGRIHWSILLSQGFLGALCLAGGIGASSIYSFVVRLLSAAGRPATSLAIYSPDNLLGAFLVAVAGAALFYLATTPTGALILKAVRERPRNFQGLFISYSLGTAVLAVWLLL